MRQLATEAWFDQHPQRRGASLDITIADMMRQLCIVVDEAKKLIAEEAARRIVDIHQSV